MSPQSRSLFGKEKPKCVVADVQLMIREFQRRCGCSQDVSTIESKTEDEEVCSGFLVN